MQRQPKRLTCMLLAAAVVYGMVGAQTTRTIAADPDASNSNPMLIESRRIWDRAPHNAFTDLLRFQDRWYCVFREGTAHVSPDGALRVITSSDGEHSESASLVTSPTYDLRDAKISVTPGGQLMLNGAGMLADAEVRYYSMSWFSSDGGRTWDEGHAIGDPGFWLWRTQWHDGNSSDLCRLQSDFGRSSHTPPARTYSIKDARAIFSFCRVS